MCSGAWWRWDNGSSAIVSRNAPARLESTEPWQIATIYTLLGLLPVRKAAKPCTAPFNFWGQLIQSTKSLTMNDLWWWAICSVKQRRVSYLLSCFIIGHFTWSEAEAPQTLWAGVQREGRNALWDHGTVCESSICFPISQSDKRRWMSFCSGGCGNLFIVIESAEQKRQTSALKSFSAWAEWGIFTISLVNMVLAASKHECYQ